MTWWGLRKHDTRIDREVAFLELGRKISQQIRDAHAIPQNAEELKTTGWLQNADWEFFTQNRVIYIPPRTNSPGETLVLRMPSEGNVFFTIQLDGYMNKERPSDSGPK